MTPALWRNRDFVIFWFGQSISIIGTAMAAFALPLLVLETTGSVAQMGVVAAISGVGALIASLVGGLLADRVNRRHLLMWCDGVNVLLYASIPITWIIAGPQLHLLYAIAAPLGFFGTTFFIGYSATVTNLVERAQLTEANSRLQGTAAFATIIGPLLAGIVISHWSATSAMTVNAFSFVISVVSVGFVRLRPAPVAQTNPEQDQSLLTKLLGGFRFIVQNPTMRWMVVVRSGMFVVTGGSTAILIFRLKNELGVPDTLLGLIFGIGAVGAIVSSIVAPRLRQSFGFGICFLGGTALVGVTLLMRGIVVNPYLFMGFAAIASFGDTLVLINTLSLRHAITPDHLQGRVAAFLQTSIFVLAPISTAFSTGLAAQLGAAPVLVLMGVLVLVLVTLGAFTPVREAHPERLAVPVEATSG